MNSFLFGFHPRGTSMELCLAEAGFEVWSLNLRAQGGSRATSPDAEPPSFAAFAGVDLPTAQSWSILTGSTGGENTYAYIQAT